MPIGTTAVGEIHTHPAPGQPARAVHVVGVHAHLHGYAAADRSAALREHLVNTARPFIFDTGLAPASAGAALGALRQLVARPELAARTREVAARLADIVGIAHDGGLT